MNFKRLLSRLRSEAGLTNDELAQRLTALGHRKSGEAVAKWQRETGRKARPESAEVVIALQQALGVSDDSLLHAYQGAYPDIEARVARIEAALVAHGILDEDGTPTPPSRTERVAAAKKQVSRRRRSGPARAG